VSAVASPPAQQPTQPAPADPSVAPDDACPLCGAPLAPTQEWCMRCGAAARTRLAAAPNWKAPVAVLATVALLSLGAIAAALVKLAGDTGPAPPAVTRTVIGAAAGAAAAPATAAPGAAATTTPPASATGAPATSTPGAPTATTPGATTPHTTAPATRTPNATTRATGTVAPRGGTGTTGAPRKGRLKGLGPPEIGIPGVHSEPGVPESSSPAGGGK
jgi:hypothetical protein